MGSILQQSLEDVGFSYKLWYSEGAPSMEPLPPFADMNVKATRMLEVFRGARRAMDNISYAYPSFYLRLALSIRLHPL